MSYELTPENIAIEFGERTGRKDSLQLQVEQLLKETIERKTEEGYFSTVIADAISEAVEAEHSRIKKLASEIVYPETEKGNIQRNAIQFFLSEILGIRAS